MAIKISGASSIKTLSGLATRPTPSKVRAAVFNMWQWKIRRSQLLDICSGSGAMSAEALVKGASYVAAIDLSRSACKLIQQNLEKVCKPEQKFEIYCGDVIKVLPKLTKLSAIKFDLIYFDPPYQSQLYEPVLEAIASLMSSESVIAVEHSRDRSLPAIPSHLQAIDQRLYGQTSVSFYSRL
jgi:16S rRNA (guanine(966)-N(2))-methyltransferase RsmD